MAILYYDLYIQGAGIVAIMNYDHQSKSAVTIIAILYDDQ